MFYKKVFAIVFLTLLCYSQAAPRSKSKSSSYPSTTFDQKQTGEYNIQLHLKDFNVIAVVADESFGDIGDYDYSYDYSDLTIKPSSSTAKPSSTIANPTTQKLTTQKTSAAITSSTTTATTSHIPTIKPDNHRIPEKPSNNYISVSSLDSTLNKSTDLYSSPVTQNPTNAPITTTTTIKIITDKLETENQKGSVSVLSFSPEQEQAGISTTTQDGDDRLDSSVSSESTKKDSDAKNQEESENDKSQNSSLQSSGETVGIIKDDNLPVVLGEIMHYRKCSVGYARDKRGRCRRIRKPVPQLSFDISRLASGLAAKFRRHENENQQQQ